MRAPLRCQREAFSVPPGLHYLNCAYMSPLPRVAEEAGLRGIRRKRVPAEITAADFFDEAEELRRSFARLINADDASRVAIIPAVSYGIATIARNLEVSRGANIVVTGEQFPSNFYPWRALAHREGLDLRAVAAPPTEKGRGEQWNERLLEAIDGSTALVAVPEYHWCDGTRFDLAAIGERARRTGAAFVVDGTQSVGAARMDIAEVRPDALMCAGYKWLLGPYSIGLAWYGSRFDGGLPLEETWFSRKGSEDFRRVADYTDEYRPGAARFEVGERSNFVLVPMLSASLACVLEWGAESIQAYCGSLIEPFLTEVRDLGVWVEDREWRGAHLVGLRVPTGTALAELESALAADRVFVSLRGSAVRVSPNVYNDSADLDALLNALREVLA